MTATDEAALSAPQAEERAYRSLDPRARTWWRLRTGLVWTPLLALAASLGTRLLAGFTDLHLPSPFLPAAAACGVGLLLTAWLPGAVWRRYGFLMTAGEIRIRNGILFRVDIWIPYRRLQYVELKQGPFERGLGIASLVLHTAGSEGAQVLLPGLELNQARELRETLLGLIEDERF